jgi:NAD(P)-dependent dehydrogenase (short-subunit alcohol dehydrogenase family)
MSSIAREPLFFHEPLVERILHSETMAVQIRGGRGVGKTTVLAKLARGLDTTVVEGRRPDAKAAMQHAIDRGGAVLIDDLDVVFDAAVYELLSQLADHLTERRIIFTSTQPPDVSVLMENNAYLDHPWDPQMARDWSSLTMQFHAEPIEPWPSNWQRRIGELVRTTMSPAAPADELIASWATVTTQLTGGHPVLLDAAIAEIGRMHTDQAWVPGLAARDKGRSTIERRRMMHSHLEEHLFSTAFRRLRKVSKEMQDVSPNAYEFLIGLARGTTDAEPPLGIKRVLIDSALVFRGARSPRLVIAGELLRRSLAGETMSRLPSIVVEPNPNEKSRRGIVTVDIGGQREIVEFRGSVWRIVMKLHEQQHRAVSVTELMEAADLENEAAVRSAIQRLRLDFLEVGVDGIIENVWGQGYQLGSFPLLAATGR